MARNNSCNVWLCVSRHAISLGSVQLRLLGCNSLNKYYLFDHLSLTLTFSLILLISFFMNSYSGTPVGLIFAKRYVHGNYKEVANWLPGYVLQFFLVISYMLAIHCAHNLNTCYLSCSEFTLLLSVCRIWHFHPRYKQLHQVSKIQF